jgi:uncharacterized protein YeaO (DUF488 family)
MKVYTSYYAKISRNPMGLVPVSISTSTPTWFPWITEEIRCLVPGWELVNGIKAGSITQEEYTERYKEKLASLSKDVIWEQLKSISETNGCRDLVLLCYEKVGDFCHRHLVADWLGGVEELK